MRKAEYQLLSRKQSLIVYLALEDQRRRYLCRYLPGTYLDEMDESVGLRHTSPFRVTLRAWGFYKKNRSTRKTMMECSDFN